MSEQKHQENVTRATGKRQGMISQAIRDHDDAVRDLATRRLNADNAHREAVRQADIEFHRTVLESGRANGVHTEFASDALRALGAE